MPVQVTRTLYLLSELPTEKAKERARDWWRKMECEDPSNEVEYRATIDAAALAIRNLSILAMTPDTLPLTGYYMDHVAIVEAKKAWGERDDTFPKSLRKKHALAATMRACAREWEREMESRMESSYVDEQCAVGEYYFNERGEREDV